ncbi:single-stranded DNA-binding protein [Kistimonas scapharcae]|uniref:Single-stranded DNA-binding protein n=1 Tax=Kistimonas scapharcae TaxID=1036133 RepID=A0ABP8UW26_9GAMM
MRGVNEVTLIGTTGKAAELRYFDNGGCIALGSLATHEHWTDKQNGKPMERTEWHNLVWRGKSAETAAAQVGKGRSLYVRGSIRSRMAKRRDGSEMRITEILVFDWQLLDRATGQKPAATQSTSTPPQPATATQAGSGFDDDDIPFLPRDHRQVC